MTPSRRASAALWRAIPVVLCLSCGTGKDASPTGEPTDTGEDSSEETGDDTGTSEAPDPCPGTDDEFADLVAFVDAELTAHQVPGGAVAIVCGGELAHAAGVGLTHHISGESVTADTRFQFASVTKMFTAAAAVSLFDAEALDLHTPIETWVPYTNTQAPYDEPITLHQLLTHSSGYPGQFTDGTWTSYDLDSFFANNADQQLWSPPGAVYNYSNNGYGLAGLVVQEVAGQAFAEIVADRVFAPAGMDRATLDPDQVLADPDYATGHSGDPTNPTLVGPDSSYLPTGYYGPMGGAWGSVRDLARWAEVHLQAGGAVLSAESHGRLVTPHIATHAEPEQSMGYGVFIDQLSSPAVLDHSGSVAGFYAHWMLIPDAGFGVFVLVNADAYWPSPITDRARELFDMTDEVDFGPYTIPESDHLLFEGTYTGNDYLGDVTVHSTTSGLEVSFHDSGATSVLTPYWSDLFALSWGGRTMTAVLWRDTPDQPAQYFVTGYGVGTREDD